MAEDVKITITTIDHTKDTVKKIDKDFNGLLSTFAKVTAGAAAIGYAAKQIYELGKAGAEIQYTEERFDRLAASIGTTGDALERDLHDATRGMMSDAEMLAGASDLMALGLAKTHDEAVRLTRVSSALGMNMNQLVLTLTNQTTMRFDALGVSVDGFDEKVKALKESGLDANEAFKQAFLQQAESQLELVGDKADSAAGSYQRFESAIKNATDAMKEQASHGISPLIGELADLLEASTDQAVVQFDYKRALDAGIISQEEYNEQIRQYQGAIVVAADAEEWLTKKLEDFNTEADAMARYLKGGVIPAVKEAGSEASITAGMTRDFADDMYEGENAARAMGEALATGAKKTKELRGALDELMGLDPSFFSTIASTLDKIDWKKAGGGDIEEAVESASNAFDTGKITIDEYKGILDEAAATALVVEGNIDGLNDVEIAAHLSEQLGTPPEEALLKVQEVQAALDRMTAKDYIISVNVRQNGGLGGATYDTSTRRAAGSGTWETVPPGYPNDSYMVGMSSGERFNVSAAGQSGGGSGATINIYPLPGQDENMIAAKVAAILRGGGQMARAGAGYIGA